MSTLVCNYAVLRFQPYPETGEFANLGIVMLCSDGRFLYRVETRASQRVTHFFDKLPAQFFRAARREFVLELERLTQLMEKSRGDGEGQRRLFRHLIAPRETVFRFSVPGTAMVETPQKELDTLFMRYVHHDFDRRPSHEALLTGRVSDWLKRFTNRTYSESVLGDELHQVRLPLVWQVEGRPRQAIKPISFRLKDSSAIIDKGDRWLMRMKRLVESDQAPLDTVFVSQQPDDNQPVLKRAYDEVINTFATLEDTRVVPYSLGATGVQKAVAEIPSASRQGSVTH
ncbi:DUF3037 domain-containing protein [Kushneria aurantia]|uniref:DUF3037 domain-containing protein n=1 Tax=Kushneria aurantia TaxID=504092 RepID=A0ABV6G0R4_9GAMM|nr:DUF3037 domain-containing protein [Kushneria aurantia]